MTNELTKIIVKVGSKSNVKFSHCKMYRAILASDLDRISKAHPDCNIVVIENIAEEEQEEVKNFAFEFNNIDEKHKVFFFIPDGNDTITSGIADELDYDIYLTLDDLYKAIYKLYNINVSVFIDDKAKYNAVVDEGDIPGLDISGIPAFDVNVSDDDLNSNDDAVENIETDTEDNNEEQAQEIDTPDNFSSDTSELVMKLKQQVNDIKYDYKQAVKDIKEATEHSDKLEEIIRVLKEEKADIEERFNSIASSTDVIEEPISLAEYEGIQAELKSKDTAIKELENSIENLKSAINDYKTQLESSSESIKEKDNTIEKLNSDIDGLNAKIASGELIQGTIDEYSAKLDEVNALVNQLQEDKDRLSELSSNEASQRIKLVEFISAVLKKYKEIYDKVKELEISLVEANESINDYRTKYEDASNRADNLTIDNANQADELAKLRQETESANKRAELANNYADSEKQELSTKITELETNLKIVQEQLEYKETQYKALIEQSKSSSTETEALVTTNNNLDMLNKTLREKLGTATKELESYKNSKAEMQNTIKQYQSQVKRLTDALNSVSVNGAVTNVTSGSVQKALYTESAQIITVFGSGSFGITTTAMSLANKLCATSKVLYIDFDLVAPKADAWFSKVPICRNIPGIPAGDMRMSGLGIFYELGIDTFKKYAASIINQCDRTKGGGIDYISGVYYRVDAHKIEEANYSELFNFLGSMYQYIIIDLGRLGSSETNDNLIKMLSDIATRNIVVTTSDKFEVRNFRLKLNDNKINLNSIAWLVNMCEVTSVDEKVKQSISPCNFGIMLNDSTLHGKRERFTRNKLNKDRLDMFTNTVLFSSRK